MKQTKPSNDITLVLSSLKNGEKEIFNGRMFMGTLLVTEEGEEDRVETYIAGTANDEELVGLSGMMVKAMAETLVESGVDADTIVQAFGLALAEAMHEATADQGQDALDELKALAKRKIQEAGGH